MGKDLNITSRSVSLIWYYQRRNPLKIRDSGKGMSKNEIRDRNL